MKKFILFLLIITLIFAVNANAETVQGQAGERLRKLEILKGYDDGSLKLERQVTRAEFSTLLIRILGYEENPIIFERKEIFTDATQKHWAFDNVMMAHKLGIIQGYSDKTFRPEKNVSKAEAIAMVIRTLGYDSDAVGEWPDNYLNLAKSMGVTKNIEVSKSNDPITRGEVAVIIDNSLKIKVKQFFLKTEKI